jgi:hypothetical protein
MVRRDEHSGAKGERMNTTEISANIKAREDAQDFMVFVDEQAGEQPQRFWEVLAGLIASKLPPHPQPDERFPAMNEREASVFEETPMPYGKHAGDAVGAVPCDYLLFLTEGDEFSKRLRRYVKSKRFADRQED